MRITKLFGKTLRENPAEAELTSHLLLLRASMIYQVSSGVYSYLPLAWRSLRNIEQIIREEMDAVSGQELRLPVLQPQKLWDESGRTEAFGSNLFTLEDRRGRQLVMAPTHEEVLTNMVKSNVHSYRDLPLILYQIQTKFRDEERPRGGLIRVREFDMKDAYSFDADDAGLDKSYQSMIKAYEKIYARCGLSVVMVEADSGAIGGKDSHEFMALADSGEDTVVLCSGCNYAANVEAATFIKPAQDQESLAPLEETHTPGIKKIEDLASYMSVPPIKTLKTVVYAAKDELVIVTIRGDLEVNKVKLMNVLGVPDIRLATPEEMHNAGLVVGSVSPLGQSGLKVIADDSVNLGYNFVAGANKKNHHLSNTNYPRDFQSDVLTDISLAQEGHDCIRCGSTLIMRRGIEVGHVFKLGVRYSEILGACFPDQGDVQRHIIMGCYGIGVGRLLAAAVEQNHDENGIIFPTSIAPYQVWLTALNIDDDDVAQAANTLYEDLRKEDIQVLYDDREESAGVKFNDADLLGLPIRMVISPRNLKRDAVELKLRSENQATLVPRGEAIKRVNKLLTTL